jgi:hypothetical protein
VFNGNRTIVAWRTGIAATFEIVLRCELSYDGLIGSGARNTVFRPSKDGSTLVGYQLAQVHLGDHPPAANVRMLPASHSLPASGHQVEDQDHQCDNEQQVD